MILQLNPMIPVHVVAGAGGHPVGNGFAFAIIDYSSEHHVLWGVAFDDTGQVWWIQNTDIRFQRNASLGRILTDR